MPTPVVWALSAVLVILAVTLGVVAVTSGVDPLVLVGVLTTVGAWFAPSPISRTSDEV
jgi:hypothetical protein